ncbi:MAG: hypothetical protein WCV67_16460 [Victivallaceae bacterium]|jgi:hypothetical protein
MRFIELTLLAGLLMSGYPGQGQDAIKGEKSAVLAVVDCKAILEKFVQAYSALDDKAMTALADRPETVAATLKEMQEFKQAGMIPVLTITPLQTRTEKDITAIDALVSLSVKDKYLYRNGPALYMFKDGKLAVIKKNFNPAFVSSFWQAVLQADKIGVLESADRAKELKLSSLLPDEKLDGKVSYPDWLIYQVRSPGKYLVPLKKSPDGYAVMGQYYLIPALGSTDPKKLADAFKRYRELKPEAERAFLKELLADNAFAMLAQPCIGNLAAMGEFRNPLEPQELKYWQDIYARKTTPTVARRHLLLVLSGSNFLQSKATFTEALQDPELSEFAGAVWSRKDKAAFEELMIKWLGDPKLCQYALQNSSMLSGNPKYVTAAMKVFDPKSKDKASLKYFMPVLCAPDNSKGEKFVKTFLTESISQDDLVLYQKTFEAICHFNPTGYPDEIKLFLSNHKKDELLLKSTVYPMALFCLCKSGDPAGYKAALDYITKIQTADASGKHDLNQEKIFMMVFFQYAPRYKKLDQFKQDFQEKLAALEKAKATVKKDEPKKS